MLCLIEAMEGGGVQAADPNVARAAWLGARLAGGGRSPGFLCTKVAGTMPLTQEIPLANNFPNNNDHSYLHKKFKKMASPMATKSGEARYRETSAIANGSFAAAHLENERIKIKQDKQHAESLEVEKNVQTNFNNENSSSRISNVNNIVHVAGQTSFTDEFLNKTENLENDFIRDACNGGVSGRHICPYCKLSCAKPSVLQKHIRAHTNERPYPCVPCGFAFKTKSNLYKHRRSRTHALRLQGADVAVAINEDDLSGGSESDTSMPATTLSETGSDVSINRVDNIDNSKAAPGSPDLITEGLLQTLSTSSASSDIKSKTIYKPKFRAALYQDCDEKDKLKKSISPNADFLTEHISKIISDNEAIVDVIETPLQKKYGKIKQIAESKQFSQEFIEVKSEPAPLNLTKNNDLENSFRKRSHSESFSHSDFQKHPLNPEGSIIKDLLLKTKMNALVSVTGELIEGPLFICPLCQIAYRSADNLETHRMYYCKGNTINNVNPINAQKELKMVRPENLYMRSNSINVRLPETPPNTFIKSNMPAKSSPSRVKPDNLVIMKPESNDIIAPLPSPGPLLGNTRLVDTRIPSEYNRKNDSLKIRSLVSPKRKIDCRSDTYSPRLAENISPRSADIYSSQSKIRCIDGNIATLRSMEDMSQHMRNNSTSLQMFGGEVKIVDHLGSTTTLRIEPNKNQLSPILIQQNLSPSKLVNDIEASSVVVRSGLHSGGTIVHNPPTPKEVTSTPQPQTPRISISTAPGISNSSLPNIHDITHFQFPPLSAITAFNPLTLPPLSPSLSPNGATTILHGGKLIPHVPGMPGPSTPGNFVGTPNSQSKSIVSSDVNKNQTLREDSRSNSVPITNPTTKTSLISKYETQQLRNTRSPHLRSSHIEQEKQILNQDHYSSDVSNYISTVPVIKVKSVDEVSANPKTFSPNVIKGVSRPEATKRSSDGLAKTVNLKDNTNYAQHKLKIRDKFNSYISSKTEETKTEKEIRSFNFENLITKAEIYNNQIPSSSDVQKNTNAQDTSVTTVSNERSETSYFQKNVMVKPGQEERKTKFLRPSTLPLKPGTFTPKRHHGITPNANTMPLVSPETPRPAKAYGQLYLNGNAYTYLGLKCSTKVFYCTINRPQPTYVPNQHFLSMYSNWQLLSELTPDPLGLSASSAMSLYDSRHRPQNVAVAVIKQDLILTHSSQWNKITKENKQSIQSVDVKKSEDNLQISDNMATPKKELTGGFESNEEYTYVRGRGRGRYVCSECGIRCKKPSMLKKHIRTHTDVRPYTCVHCAFSFKTKGNLTKHMKSKAHYKKCCELGINPNEGNDAENGENAQCSGETDDDTDSEGDEGNEGETESSDTEAYKSRLPEHEAAHCLLSLGGSRPTTSATPGLLTSARPSTYPYTPMDLDCSSMETIPERLNRARSLSVDSRTETENEPMDLSKNEMKASSNITEIPTARESSVLASLASNTAKLPQQQTQWTNGEPMLHTYLTERALLDSRIKQSQLTYSLSKLRKSDTEKATLSENYILYDNVKTVNSIKNTIMTSASSLRVLRDPIPSADENDITIKVSTATKIENIKVLQDPVTTIVSNTDTTKRIHIQTSTNAENAKHVVSEYLKHARINLIKTTEENLQNQNDHLNDDINIIKTNSEENATTEDSNASETESVKLPSLEHDPVARKVVIGVGGVVKVTKMKDFENSTYSPGRLMEDGRRVCDFCNKTFTKPSQLRLHLNIHYMERPFRCGVCAVSFRTRGHLQKHERSGSHHNKVSMTSTFGAATSFNPRPFRCSDCNIAFRIHGHLAKHLRSKMHVMRLECLFKLPFGTFTEIERAGVSLTDIDTTDCASSLASLQSLARKLHEKDPSKLEYREGGVPAVAERDSDEEDDALTLTHEHDHTRESDMDKHVNNVDSSDGRDIETQVNYSATDI
ncbi:hypothetical protein K1T71_001811 [Dendrolimus kikuchii]|uniref:Uncharacterized protein n=1 Tax=Dendrolimus kikuchii TaxID=765133 RepID=A0ACC1DFQ0_9NEOP|nr:hypothetical protein K1T71_001811 [Dendrolimus kikuchii]